MTEFPVPIGIPTAVSEPELRVLQRYAHEAGTVLEIGTWFGYTCIGMAMALQPGGCVTSVDPHNACDFSQQDSWELFCQNVERSLNTYRLGVADDLRYWSFGPMPAWQYSPTIMAHRARIEDCEGARNRTPYGMVFIDGDHGGEAPMRDARIALSVLRDPGYLAFHDVGESIFPDVLRAVRTLEESGEIVFLERERYLAVYQSSASGVSGKSSTPAVAE